MIEVLKEELNSIKKPMITQTVKENENKQTNKKEKSRPEIENKVR